MLRTEPRVNVEGIDVVMSVYLSAVFHDPSNAMQFADEEVASVSYM